MKISTQAQISSSKWDMLKYWQQFMWHFHTLRACQHYTFWTFSFSLYNIGWTRYSYSTTTERHHNSLGIWAGWLWTCCHLLWFAILHLEWWFTLIHISGNQKSSNPGSETTLNTSTPTGWGRRTSRPSLSSACLSLCYWSSKTSLSSTGASSPASLITASDHALPKSRAKTTMLPITASKDSFTPMIYTTSAAMAKFTVCITRPRKKNKHTSYSSRSSGSLRCKRGCTLIPTLRYSIGIRKH